MEWLLFFFVFFPLVTAFFCAWCSQELTLWKVSLVGATLSLATSLLFLWCNPSITLWLPLFRYEGITLQTNPFGLVMATLACTLWWVSVFTGREYFLHKKGSLTLYYTTLFLVLTGCLGVFFAVDLFTLFLFFELMSFVSTAWVAQDRSHQGIRATLSYLAYGVLGGMSILFGLFLLSSYSPDLLIALPEGTPSPYPEGGRRTLAVFLILVGFGIKAGLFFLHDWLPTAHTVSPAPASGLLSGLLTKTGVIGVLVVITKLLPHVPNFAYTLLLWSTLTLFLGAVCALLSGNLKRVLAFSTVSQIGFLLWGVALINLLGEHKAVAVYGLIFHLVTHSLAKILLFSLAGVVYQRSHTLELVELKGYGQGKPWLHGLFVVGALSLSGLPLGAAYASKSLLHEAMSEYIHLLDASLLFLGLEWVFTLTGGITMAYLTKLYLCLFWSTPETPWKHQVYASRKTLITLSLVATGLLSLGVLPHLVGMELGHYVSPYFQTHHLEDVHFFSLSHLTSLVIPILFAAFVFKLYVHMCHRHEISPFQEHPLLQGTFQDVLYRPFFNLLALFFGVIARFLDVIVDVLLSYARLWWCKPLKIPDSFFHGDDNRRKRHAIRIHLTYSLSYSLLMFGMGFLFTIVYLLVVGGS